MINSMRDIFSSVQVSAWPAASLTVNLSIQSISDPEFHQWLDDIVSNHQQQAERLMIERSEQQYHGDSEEYIRFLDRFRPHGVHFSIDQFGINSTSFGFLQGLKLEQLKIDGSYISKLHQNRNNQFFLRSLTDIAHNLEIKIVANFVEDEDEDEDEDEAELKACWR